MADMLDLAVKGAMVVSPTAVFRADLGVRDGCVVALGDEIEDAHATIDATGLHLFPGVIDTQVHFREPGLEWKEDLATGTAAAAAGGVTTILEMPNTDPTTTTPEALADKLARAEGRCWCDYGFFFGASTTNLDDLAQAERLPGTPGIKLFAGSSTGSLLVEDEASIRRVLQNGVRPVAVHSEDEPRLRERKASVEVKGVESHPEIRDAEAAVISTERLIRLCRETGRAVHILHISTRDELALLRDAKREGLPVTCEVTPQHLTFCADDYTRLGTRLQMNPPVRAVEHREGIRAAVQEGLFDVFGSDHAPHTLEEKARPYPQSPSGMPGVQTLFPVVLDMALAGHMSLSALVDMTSRTPAKLYGMKGKGRIALGYDADFVLVDLNGSWTVKAEDMRSRSAWSPYEGMTLKGRVHQVFLRGRDANSEPSGRPVQYTWKD